MHGIILTGFVPVGGIYAQYKRTAGGHRIATYLRERDWDIEVLDFVMGWSLDQLQEFTNSRVSDKTVFIGFGGTFPIWSETIDQFFTWFRSTYPNVKIIAGGQVSNLYKITADWYVDGFGERAMEALLKHITGSSNEKLKYQLGVNGRKVVKGNQDYPSYPMKSLKIKYQDRDFILANETLVTELGRGCIFNCSFCNFPILGVKEDHSRDAEDLYEELQDTYDRYGVTKYVIADETVNDYTEKLEKFANVIKKLSFRPRLYGFARADLFVSRKQDWDIMLSMGFTGHHYGIESTNPKTLKVIGKGMDPDKLLSGLLDARSYFKKHGSYKGQISLIAGLPYETRDSLEKTIKWTVENWRTENVMLFPLYIPKNDGGDTSSKLTDDWSKYNYRETKVDLYPTIKEKFGNIPTQYGTGNALVAHTGLSWENDHWNVQDAMEIVLGYYMNNYKEVNGPVIWSVGDLELAFDKPPEFFQDKTYTELLGDNNIKNILNSHNDDDMVAFFKMNIVTDRFVREYIDKKINWRV
jgi:radical SAM superfamily enzyme YgiQ (UPF0313 family)